MNKILLFLLTLASFSQAKPVLISFDGSALLPMWKDTLAFAKENNVKFTYFVSAPYFVSESQVKENPYWAAEEIGTPYCNFRKDEWKLGTEERWNYLDEAVKDGHEIASHLCGHYDGSRWKYEQWNKELLFFIWAMNTHSNGGNKPSTNGFNGMASISGIRAPYLATNDAYFKAIKEFGYEYDSSLVGGQFKQAPDVKEIAIRKIKITSNILSGNGKTGITLPFDCNFTILNVPKETNMEDLFFNSLCLDYTESNEPSQICLHFELMDNGAYYGAMKRFVAWAKDKNPEYMTYKEYASLKK